MFILAISILGFAILIQNSARLIDRQLFDVKGMTKIGTFYVAMVLITMIALPRGYLSAWISIFVPLLATAVFVFVQMRRRASHFRQALTEVLALVALKMKAGRSFRQAYNEVVSESDPRLRGKLSEIGRAVVFSQQDKAVVRTNSSSIINSNHFVMDVIEELKVVDRQPHAASRRLSVFREKLRMEDDFRRRSGQILARIRAQSILMTGLYLALAIFVALKFGWNKNERLFAMSLALFAAGSFWIWWGGRRMKWKV